MIYELNPEKIIYPYLVKVRADSARKTIRRLTCGSAISPQG